MLKPVGESLTRNEIIYMVSKYLLLTKHLLTTKGKVNKFTVEKTGRHHLSIKSSRLTLRETGHNGNCE